MQHPWPKCNDISQFLHLFARIHPQPGMGGGAGSGGMVLPTGSDGEPVFGTQFQNHERAIAMKKRDAAAAFRRTAISVAIGMCIAGVVHAQGADGNIVGKAKAGASVTLTTPSGATTQAKAQPDGSFSFSKLAPAPTRCRATASRADVVVAAGVDSRVALEAAERREDHGHGFANPPRHFQLDVADPGNHARGDDALRASTRRPPPCSPRPSRREPPRSTMRSAAS